MPPNEHGCEHSVNGESWVELHVDQCDCAFNLGRMEQFGGKMSVRVPQGTKPLVLVGQDEASFNQFSFKKSNGSPLKGK